MALHGVAASARRISRQLRDDLWSTFSAAFTQRRSRFIIEAFGFFSHDPAANEAFE